METSMSPYVPPFSNYAQISCKSGTQPLQKSWHLNFENEFEFGALEKSHNHRFPLIDQIRKIE